MNIAMGMGKMKYASQYADSVNEASNGLSSQVFISCLTIVGSRLLLIAHRKKRLNTSESGSMYRFRFILTCF